MDTIKFLEYECYSGLLSDIFSGQFNKKIVLTINPHSYITAENDEAFKNALKNTDILLADGVGITLASRLLGHNTIPRYTGYDLFNAAVEWADKISGSIFFLGSTNETLSIIKNRMSIEYPGIRIGTLSPPFDAVIEDEDNEVIIKTINRFRADIVFVGMTAPKQEKWIYNNFNKLDFRVIAGIGAVFDFYSGKVKRAPAWVRKAGLEWLHRSINNPGRLGLRNAKSNPKFILDILSRIIGIK